MFQFPNRYVKKIDENFIKQFIFYVSVLMTHLRFIFNDQTNDFLLMKYYVRTTIHHVTTSQPFTDVNENVL